MAIVTMPSDLPVGAFTWAQVRYDLAEVSDATGDAAVRLLGPPRWRISMSSTREKLGNGAKWEAMLLQLRGRVNTLAAYDPLRAAPQGTLRGAPFLRDDVPVGATSCVLADAVGTLLSGDLLQIGAGLGTSQLVKLTADAASSILTAGSPSWVNGSSQVVGWVNGSSQAVAWANGGQMTVNFEAPLRRAYQAGTAVSWNRPIAYFKATNPNAGWSYRAGGGLSVDNFSLDLLEVFA